MRWMAVVEDLDLDPLKMDDTTGQVSAITCTRTSIIPVIVMAFQLPTSNLSSTTTTVARKPAIAAQAEIKTSTRFASTLKPRSLNEVFGTEVSFLFSHGVSTQSHCTRLRPPSRPVKGMRLPRRKGLAEPVHTVKRTDQAMQQQGIAFITQKPFGFGSWRTYSPGVNCRCGGGRGNYGDRPFARGGVPASQAQGSTTRVVQGFCTTQLFHRGCAGRKVLVLPKLPVPLLPPRSKPCEPHSFATSTVPQCNHVHYSPTDHNASARTSQRSLPIKACSSCFTLLELELPRLLAPDVSFHFERR